MCVEVILNMRDVAIKLKRDCEIYIGLDLRLAYFDVCLCSEDRRRRTCRKGVILR